MYKHVLGLQKIDLANLIKSTIIISTAVLYCSSGNTCFLFFLFIFFYTYFPIFATGCKQKDTRWEGQRTEGCQRPGWSKIQETNRGKQQEDTSSSEEGVLQKSWFVVKWTISLLSSRFKFSFLVATHFIKHNKILYLFDIVKRFGS